MGERMYRSTRIWLGTEENVIADAEELHIPFSLRGISGLIAVSVTRNTSYPDWIFDDGYHSD
jgi:hypothetical protein